MESYSDKSNSITQNIIWKILERSLAQFITILVSIILARLLSPSDYGIIAIVFIFITFADVIIRYGLGNSLIQNKNSDQIDFSSVFFFNLMLSISLYLLIFISAPLISNYYGFEILSPVIRVLGLKVIFSAINSVQQAYISKKMKFKKNFYSSLFGTLVSGVIGIVMAYRGYGVWSLVYQQLTSAIIISIVLWITVKWRPNLVFSFSRVKILYSYGWKILFEGLFVNLEDQIRNLIIGKYYSASDLGYYSKARQFPNLITTNIILPISTVLFPAMSNHQDNKDHILFLLRKSVIFSSYIIFPMLLGISVVAEPFVKVVLTDKWILSVPYLRLFAISYSLTVGMTIRHQALNAIGRSDIFMYEHMVSRIIGLTLLVFVYKWSILAVLLSAIITTFILGMIIMYTSKKYNNYSYKDQIADVMPTIIISIVMGFLVNLIFLLNQTSLVTLSIQVVTGFTVYVLLSYLFRIEGFQITTDYIKFFFKKVYSKKEVI